MSILLNDSAGSADEESSRLPSGSAGAADTTDAVATEVSEATEATEATADDFESFFRAHVQRLCRLAEGLGAGDAEDVVQEVFIRLSTRFHRLPEGDGRVRYLNRCVVNASRDHVRQAQRRQRLGRSSEPPGVAESAEQIVGRSEAGQRLVEALARIGRRQREAIVLRYWGGLDYREIAAVMRVRTGTVKSLLSRGQQQLINHLEGK